MRPTIDLVGQRFGKLLIVAPATSIARQTRWLCLCDCGKEKVIFAVNLKKGRTKSCGCEQYSSKYHFDDLSGRQFGLWTVIHRVESRSNGSAIWFCRCDCGVTRNVIAYSLLSGQSTGCGCTRNKKRKKGIAS